MGKRERGKEECERVFSSSFVTSCTLGDIAKFIKSPASENRLNLNTGNAAKTAKFDSKRRLNWITFMRPAYETNE